MQILFKISQNPSIMKIMVKNKKATGIAYRFKYD